MPAEWTDAELDLLSAYIDEQLDDGERTALEARLANDADLRQELAAMRQTVALLRDLPTIRAPRAFTLTPEMVGQKAVPVLTIAPAAAPAQEKRQRPTSARRVWWIPAASAAGVVLLAGIFAVTQMSTRPASAPINGGGSVALLNTATNTPTQVQDPSSLNTVVDLRMSVTATVTATTTPTSSPEATLILAQTEAKIATVEDQAGGEPQEIDSTAADENVVPVPPLANEQSVATRQQMPVPVIQPTSQPLTSTGSSEQPQPGGAMTDEEFAPSPRFSSSPTAMTAYGAQTDLVPLATETVDIMSLPSGGGMMITTSTPDQAMMVAPADSPVPEMVAGMVGVNSDPNAPGFSVSTVAPVQETIIAEYHEADSQVADTVTTLTESVTTTAGRPPIWIRWINTLADWLRMLSGQR